MNNARSNLDGFLDSVSGAIREAAERNEKRLRLGATAAFMAGFASGVDVIMEIIRESKDQTAMQSRLNDLSSELACLVSETHTETDSLGK